MMRCTLLAGGRRMLEPSAAAEVAAAHQAANAAPQNDWADQFSNMRLDNGAHPGGWADEFAQVMTLTPCAVSTHMCN